MKIFSIINKTGYLIYGDRSYASLFLNREMTCPRTTLGHFFSLSGLPHSQLRLVVRGGPLVRGQPHLPDVNLCVFIKFCPKSHRESRYEVGSLSPAERLVRFKPDVITLGYCHGDSFALPALITALFLFYNCKRGWLPRSGRAISILRQYESLRPLYNDLTQWIALRQNEYKSQKIAK